MVCYDCSPLSNKLLIPECFSDGCDVPLIFPSQLRLLDCLAVEVGIGGTKCGLFVISEMKGDVLGGARLGEGIGTVGRLFRTGVKPDCRLFKTLRTLGVLFSTSSASGEKAWTGMFSHASKSSGADRFLPITTAEGIGSTST